MHRLNVSVAWLWSRSKRSPQIDQRNHFRQALHHHSRPRSTVRTTAPAAALNAAAANARATLTLTLAALGVINVIDSLGVPWSSLVTALLLALLALVFFVAAQHSHDKRFSWLLSASVATGLAIAGCYNLINVAPAASAAVLVPFIAILLLVVRCLTRNRATGLTHAAVCWCAAQLIPRQRGSRRRGRRSRSCSPTRSAAEPLSTSVFIQQTPRQTSQTTTTNL
jgi:protein-S-isoprenylcysteine O-methyltransferase Ste14